jgi:hypothetical protein
MPKTHSKFLIIALLLGTIFSYGQGKIEQSKDELKKNNKEEDNSIISVTQSENRDRPNVDNELKKSFGNVVLSIFAYASYYAVVGNYRQEDHLYNDLSAYPYEVNTNGNYVKYDSISQTTDPFRIDVENHFLYSQKNLLGNHLKFKIRPFQYFYLQTDYHQLIEKNPILQENDYLSLYHFNLNYDRLRFEKWNLGWSAGMNYIANDIQTVGFNLGVHSDVFLGSKTSISGAAKWGWINKNPVNLYDFHVKYHLKKSFIGFGYEHLKIATPSYNFVSVGGGIYF